MPTGSAPLRISIIICASIICRAGDRLLRKPVLLAKLTADLLTADLLGRFGMVPRSVIGGCPGVGSRKKGCGAGPLYDILETPRGVVRRHSRKGVRCDEACETI